MSNHQPSFDEVLNGEDYLLEANKHTAPDQFEAFIRTSKSIYPVGTFKTKPEAAQAIKDALQARWCG